MANVVPLVKQTVYVLVIMAVIHVCQDIHTIQNIKIVFNAQLQQVQLM